LLFNIVTGADNNNDTTVNDRPAESDETPDFSCFDDLNATCGLGG
jgi:hypothetical protein